jgi:uroporphyrinogen III methyltransferase/synthase
LEREGATPIEVPLTKQIDAADGGLALQQVAAKVQEYSWVILTSVNAVHRFMGYLRDARALGQTKVAAVGPTTADALRMTGVEPDLIPAEHWAQGLIEVFPDAEAGAVSVRVLFPSADQTPTTISDGLAEKGWDVQRVEAYRTVALTTPEPEVLRAMAEADAITFTATSSAKAFVALRDPNGAPLRVPPLVICIGPTTAASAEALGLAGVQIAYGASTEGIVGALNHHLAGADPSNS